MEVEALVEIPNMDGILHGDEVDYDTCKAA